MTSITSFTFSPFQENTYVISNEEGECWIIDPGCYTEAERNQLVSFIKSKRLTPVKLLNTHCHLDHIFGNAFVADTYQLSPQWHEKETVVAENAKMAAMMYGVNPPEYRAPGGFLKPGEFLTLGKASFEILFAPGHSPGSVCFYNQEEGYAIVGDVLFRESIGRTDLPGGSHQALIQSIRTQLFTLPDDVKIYNGHGEPTTIGHEKKYNPFLR